LIFGENAKKSKKNQLTVCAMARLLTLFEYFFARDDKDKNIKPGMCGSQ
jgi:hypothetical protein